MNITKKQTHRYGEQTNGYQWLGAQHRGGGIGVQTILCVRQAQGYVVQHGKYSQHFVNGA